LTPFDGLRDLYHNGPQAVREAHEAGQSLREFSLVVTASIELHPSNGSERDIPPKHRYYAIIDHPHVARTSSMRNAKRGRRHSRGRRAAPQRQAPIKADSKVRARRNCGEARPHMAACSPRLTRVSERRVARCDLQRGRIVIGARDLVEPRRRCRRAPQGCGAAVRGMSCAHRRKNRSIISRYGRKAASMRRGSARGKCAMRNGSGEGQRPFADGPPMVSKVMAMRSSLGMKPRRIEARRGRINAERRFDGAREREDERHDVEIPPDIRAKCVAVCWAKARRGSTESTPLCTNKPRVLRARGQVRVFGVKTEMAGLDDARMDGADRESGGRHFHAPPDCSPFGSRAGADVSSNRGGA